MRRTLLPMLCVATACATFGSGSDVKGRYQSGLTAFVAADYTSAVRDLAWVGNIRPRDAMGQQALLLGVAAALDPRNPSRDYFTAGRLATQLRDVGGTWTTPIGETFRLLSTELASAQNRISDAEAARDQAFAIATEQRERLESRLNAVTTERNELARKAATLEQSLAEREKQLKDKEQELERIRKIVRG